MALTIVHTPSAELDRLLADRQRLNYTPSTPAGPYILQWLDGAHRDLRYDRVPWPSYLCPGCLATIEAGDAFCAGCGASTSDTIASIFKAAYPGIIDREMRTKDRKTFSAAVRSMLKHAGITGVSVTTPSYSMASTISIRIKDKDENHPFLEENRDDSDWQDHQRRNCPRCQRAWQAEKKLETMILCAFPDCDDRSDSQTDYFDFRFIVS